MRFFRCTALFLLLSLAASAQVKVLKIDELSARFTSSNDTTYIVNFWATWCAPCVKELPDFDSINHVYAARPVKVLLVSLDFKEDLGSKVVPFLKKKNIRSEVMLLDELNGNYFIPKVDSSWTGAIPATLVINNKKSYRKFFEKKLTFATLSEEINTIQLIPQK